jgi:ubiquitin-activating enzyme E1
MPSRYVMGKEAMHRLGSAHILISGIRGLGVEIAKNIILGGAKSVIVHDTGKVDYADLASQVNHRTRALQITVFSLQYYFSESDIGHNRAETAFKKLVELNSYVNVTCSSANINEEFLQEQKVNVSVCTWLSFCP